MTRERIPTLRCLVEGNNQSSFIYCLLLQESAVSEPENDEH